MFTGIIEALGRVRRVELSADAGKLYVDLAGAAQGVGVGDSINLNGACLTVVGMDGSVGAFDVSGETLERTNLGRLAPGDPINVERALRAEGRFGGHFVLGHADAVGRIARKETAKGQMTLWFQAPPEILEMIVEKGSVAVDGVSLTVVERRDDTFSVVVIPYTIAMTTLGRKGPGDEVNIEVDIIGRWVRRLIESGPQGPPGLTMDHLRDAGFLDGE